MKTQEHFSFSIKNNTSLQCKKCKGQFLLTHFIHNQNIRLDEGDLKNLAHFGRLKVVAACPACELEQDEGIELRVKGVKKTLNFHLDLDLAEADND